MYNISMEYKNIVKGKFIDRPNRFIARVEINGAIEIVHVKNTGRCKELLVKDAVVILQDQNNPKRKTRYDLISVYKGDRLINMDSQAPNKVFGEWVLQEKLFKEIKLIRPETGYGGDSRLDFYIEANNKKIFVEVKGVTLEEKNVVKFPDAPTLRGAKHIRHLIKAMSEGYMAYLVFIVQLSGAKSFTPNYEADPEFADMLITAKEMGVQILAIECNVTENTIEATECIPVKLKKSK